MQPHRPKGGILGCQFHNSHFLVQTDWWESLTHFRGDKDLPVRLDWGFTAFCRFYRKMTTFWGLRVRILEALAGPGWPGSGGPVGVLAGPERGPGGPGWPGSGVLGVLAGAGPGGSQEGSSGGLSKNHSRFGPRPSESGQKVVIPGQPACLAEFSSASSRRPHGKTGSPTNLGPCLFAEVSSDQTLAHVASRLRTPR